MITLNPIERVNNLSRTVFCNEFAKPLRPVIITDYAKNWPAIETWNYDYFKEVVGHVDVPLYAEAFANEGNAYMKAQKNMTFREYLDLLNSSDTKLRMFLFNIRKKMSPLCKDFNYPDLVDNYLKKFPFLFFGQKGSYVDLHYDADMSHVFITQFLGKKKIILFSPKDSYNLYRHPFTVSCNVNLNDPDFSKYPSLAKTTGFECTLEPGETLFMPSGYWHYINYIDTGFSLSLRAQTGLLRKRMKGCKNIFNLMVVDNFLNKIVTPQRWYNMKEKVAVKRAEKYANRIN